MNLINCQEFFNKCKKSEETLRNILIKSEEQITIKMEEIEVPLEEETIAEDTLEGVCDVATRDDVHESRKNRKNVNRARNQKILNFHCVPNLRQEFLI